MDFISRLEAIYTRPFREDMDLVQWVLFVGLILVAAFLWSRVIDALKGSFT